MEKLHTYLVTIHRKPRCNVRFMDAATFEVTAPDVEGVLKQVRSGELVDRNGLCIEMKEGTPIGIRRIA